MKNKLLTLMTIGFISLTSCGGESKNPDKKTYYLLSKKEITEITQPGGVKKTKTINSIFVFDVKSKDITSGTSSDSYGSRYALFFIDGTASLYEYKEYFNGYAYYNDVYSYQSTLIESCDYSIVDDVFVGRRFTKEDGYLATSYTLHFESGRVVAKEKEGKIIEQYVTESYAETHNIEIIKPQTDQEN